MDHKCTMVEHLIIISDTNQDSKATGNNLRMISKYLLLYDP